jgi:hypothetical protein
MALSLGDRGKVAEMMAAIVALVKEVDDNSRFLVACSLVGLVFAVLGGLIALAFHAGEAAAARPGDRPSPAA